MPSVDPSNGSSNALDLSQGWICDMPCGQGAAYTGAPSVCLLDPIHLKVLLESLLLHNREELVSGERAILCFARSTTSSPFSSSFQSRFFPSGDDCRLSGAPAIQEWVLLRR
ncbi:hypothetical protein TcWFU_009871 [Taenia crassiceps]|uniref:Uncharacterized protein n=1 Tax=Taenia crassiceps TaxID=6207 RepID=A0ABR4QN73_9CEST